MHENTQKVSFYKKAIDWSSSIFTFTRQINGKQKNGIFFNLSAKVPKFFEP